MAIRIANSDRNSNSFFAVTIGNAAASKRAGQTFRPLIDTTTTTVSLRLARGGTPTGGTVRISIYNASQSTFVPTTEIVGVDLNYTDLTASPTYTIHNISLATSLTAYTYYSIVIENNMTGTSPTVICTFYNVSTAYGISNCHRCVYSSSTWSTNTTSDLYFIVQGSSPANYYDGYIANFTQTSDISASGTNIAAQTFTTSTSNIYITSVKLRLRRSSSPAPSTFYVDIYNTGSFVPTTEIISMSADGSTMTTSDFGEWYEFVLPSPLLLSASTRYAIVLRNPTSGTIYWTRCTYSSISDGDYYNGDQCNKSGAGAWTRQSYYDCNFQLYTISIDEIDLGAATCSFEVSLSGTLTKTSIKYLAATCSTSYTFTATELIRI
jgi:hypothetical protein